MAAVADEVVEGAQFEDVTRDPQGPIEKIVSKVKLQAPSEQLEFLLTRAMDAERTDQREDDMNYDHAIRLFSRQKHQSLCRILTTLILLTLVTGIQLVALYNLNRGSYLLDTNVLVKWLERGLWANPSLSLTPAETLNQRVRGILGGSEATVFDLPSLGFCLTPRGKVDVFFNAFIGLVMIYLFLFFDLWFVVFDMPLTRNFRHERHGKLMLLGVVWLVGLNATMVTWLGVVSGFAVIANSGDFFSVLFQSLQLFIILVVDDTVLPFIRFIMEEAGNLDEFGNLKDAELKRLTHGAQYYKPGYGHSFVRLLKGSDGVAKIIAFFSLLMLFTIVLAPAVVTLVYASNTFIAC